MATQTPDPRNFQTWEDAFQYPLPVVRKLEQQLRKNIDDNRQKLRSLVGASYRDLLGTADRITDMDDRMQGVETHLADIGRKCNVRAVERASRNYELMVKTREAGAQEHLAIVARTQVLRNALAVAARAIRRRGDALLVSKLLVLARLLHKSLAESAEPPRILEDLKRKLAGLRKKLLSYIEHALVWPNQDQGKVANSLCAYSLVSSSTPKEVLRHFLQARFEQLELAGQRAEEGGVLEMLDLYRRTLLDARTLFPRVFAEALAELANVPLLQDGMLAVQEGLSLDVYAAWLPQDVRAFTPWVRHESLLASDVGSALAAWTKQAQRVVQGAVEDCLGRVGDAGAVLGMRKKVLLQYLGLSGSLPGESYVGSVNKLREIFLAKLEGLASERAKSIALEAELDADNAGLPSADSLDLWRLSTEDLGMAHGAKHLRQTLLDQRHGRQVTLRACVRKLDDWMSSLHAFWELTLEMRSTRWHDEMDIDFDDLEDGAELHKALSKTDAEQVQAALRTAISTALQQQYQLVQQRVAASKTPEVLLRLLRELDARRLGVRKEYGAEVEIGFRDDVVQSLQHAIAVATVDAPLEKLAAGSAKPNFVAASLWDGTPALPVQPSRSVFRFLMGLQKAMSAAGSDLWSARAVDLLKTLLAGRLAEVLEGSLSHRDGQEAARTNGHAEGEDEEVEEATNGNDHSTEGPPDIKDEHSRRKLIQSLFDALYLQRIAAAGDPSTANSLSSFVTKTYEQAELDNTARERLQKSAGEYAKRTYLLFGLLAPASNS
ncbi:hypothetical protein B0A50_06876 [Salinomyces thailandicus]|uniref:Conserved oligomeric Golgi complex subunit 1 n=1 Tax=Salinomyces thailandicus TaxID=706561 RepID=A0A4U0TQH4_9PEZI|nr:hypothetical protein B0A50_06876 [Salinomyces thailandica]